MPEAGLNWAPVHIGRRELREEFLVPFEAAVREAGLATMMNAVPKWWVEQIMQRRAEEFGG